MRIFRIITAVAVVVSSLIFIAGCRHRPPETGLDSPPELTEFELERNDLRRQIEHARLRDDTDAELLAVEKYNDTYDFNESMILREMELHLLKDSPERVVMMYMRMKQSLVTHGILVMLGRAQEMLGEYSAAAAAYEQALTRQHDPDTLDRFLKVRMRSMETDMSTLLTDFGAAPWVTRDELASTLVDHFETYMPVNVRPPIIRDIELSQNQEKFLQAVAAGLVEVTRDHRAQPTSRVRKFDLVKAMYLILHFANKVPSEEILSAYTPPNDLSVHHRAWKSAVPCLAAGLVTAEVGGRFQAGKVMSGSEIVTALEALKNYLASH